MQIDLSCIITPNTVTNIFTGTKTEPAIALGGDGLGYSYIHIVELHHITGQDSTEKMNITGI